MEQLIRSLRSNQSLPDRLQWGGWPELESRTTPPDNDGDGMPDAWERAHGLNPDDAADGSKDQDKDGYTNVEEYLNGTDPTVFVDYTKPENNINTLN